MQKIFDLRFIVPPTLFLALIFIANPSWFLNLPFLTQIKSNVILSGLFGVTTLLTLGFIISSIVYFILNLSKATATYEGKEEELLKKHFEYRDKGDCPSGFLKFNKESYENVYNCELTSWKMASKEGEYVYSQIHKRWQMAMSNFNCCCASLLAAITLIILGFFHLSFIESAVYFWAGFSCVLAFVFMSIFLINGFITYKSVCTMDKILVWDFCKESNVKSVGPEV